jgi:peroxiredoxin
MPAIQQVYSDFENQGLIILGINTTNQDKKENAIAFSTKVGVTFPILFDENGLVNTNYQIRALPTTFFIDTNGIIQDITIGGPMSEALIRSKIKKILSSTK